MIVVSDTSPLCYLAILGELELLPKLFTRVAVPLIVLAELRAARSSETVRTWAMNPPEWLEVHEEAPIFAGSLADLDAGECAAILLAEKLHAELLLTDETLGRSVAQSRNLAVTGLLGVLALAAREGLLSFDAAIERLRTTNFRIAEDVIEKARAKVRG